MDQKDKIKKLFDNYRYKRFQQKIQKISGKKVTNFYAEELIRKNYFFQEIENRKNFGIVSLKFFDTLSQVLELNAFFLEHFLVKNESEKAYYSLLQKYFEKTNNSIDFILARQPIDNENAIRALLKYGFYYVCGESIFSKGITKQIIPNCKDFENITLAEKKDLLTIKEISSQYHKCNRYLRDEYFNLDVVQKLFNKSIENTYEKKWLYVYKEKNEIIGYITFLINEKVSSFGEGNRYGSLDYIVVKESHQGKNIGFLLNQYAIRELQKKQVNMLSVKTMANNYSAIRLLYRDQFTLTSQNIILHYRKL